MRKILIAEDDFFIRDIYSKVFSLSGYDVQVAVDGTDALEKITSQKYDMVLLDIMMPRMTGIDVLKNVRALTTPAKDIPIFIITNLGQQNVIEEAFKLGMDGYILKSQVSPQQIVDEINNYFISKETLPQK
ncbi:MAG TPA: response regulator [Candidatus Sulfotelmatobacter sp.]|jgi:CheY-like chemotaxis protein|nr:response regulator [Candidatus Sulfotelmatobacter sp.]